MSRRIEIPAFVFWGDGRDRPAWPDRWWTMMDPDVLRGSLADVARTFYQSKLAVASPSVEVIVEADMILIRVQGFVTAADQQMIARPEDRRVLEDYYGRLAEMIHPILDGVVSRDLGQPPVSRRTIVDLGRSECLYLLTLGEERLSGSPPAVEAGEAGGRELRCEGMTEGRPAGTRCGKAAATGGHGQILWCDRCGIEITWAPQRAKEQLYCCADCAEGRPCECGTERLRGEQGEGGCRALYRVR